MGKEKKFSYEKPISLDAGKVASVLGAVCSNGDGAGDGCVAGNDPQTAPVCQPGLTATYNCTTGTTNTNGNCTVGGTAHGTCESGTSPSA